ncbi:hypothetical protein TSUD_26530 [Trifolium subterraneum]|uniref:Phenazine biosynthesis-like domain-containing protein n=1 Tax=Trifolium subterraneum TaxID=3900 RepID=A0A2Z6NFG8_TRISU|nr:hypothetical protein TSUD_26530 [Trifolium subterraneum]
MAKKPVKYYVVDAFTDSAFKGNPAAVCLLEEEKDIQWLQSLAAEFNISETCYLIPIHGTSVPRFGLRWFTPTAEVVVKSGKDVTEVQPEFDAIIKCPGMGVIVTGVAPPESGFDIYSRYFCPKFGIDEASARGGVLNLHVDEQKQRVYLRGKAITVMEGCVLV